MIVKPSIAFNDFSGTAKEVTARNVNGRNILSLRAKHSKIVTPAQAVTRNKLSKISRAYKQLSDSQMMAWEVLASHMKGISTLGTAASLTAHNAFIRINSNRAMVGMPPLQDAPVYTSDVPEVIYDDLWIAPEAIVFTGLEVPSDTYRLVVKMSPAQSPGTTSGWSKTVIVAPGIEPDWGDADITKLYTETMGVTPEAGMKYYLECWWLDTETGFTGESMWISAICKEGSTAYNETYTPRARVTLNEVVESQGFESLDIELSHGSTILSVDATYSNNTGVASGEFVLKKTNKSLPDLRAWALARCSNPERNWMARPNLFAIWIHTWQKETEGTSAHRGGQYESEFVEVFGSGPCIEY
jgi:hypothetical protein